MRKTYKGSSINHKWEGSPPCLMNQGCTKMPWIASLIPSQRSLPLPWVGPSLQSFSWQVGRYLHKVQNYNISHEQLSNLCDAVLKLKWSRHRMGADTTSSHVHITHSRVAQPLSSGGLVVPEPHIQSKALRLICAHKLRSPNQQLTWVRILKPYKLFVFRKLNSNPWQSLYNISKVLSKDYTLFCMKSPWIKKFTRGEYVSFETWHL